MNTGSILNIGLSRNDGLSENRLSSILAELPGLLITDLRVVTSDTERTLVVVIDGDSEWLDDLATRLCLQFAQDCIAIYRTTTGEGKLVGPKADAWGPFATDKFYLPQGYRLSDLAAAHATLGRAEKRH